MYDNNIDYNECEHSEVFHNPLDNCVYCADCCERLSEKLNKFSVLEELDD